MDDFANATVDTLREAYMAHTLTRSQTRVLLVRKGYTGHQADLLLRGWAWGRKADAKRYGVKA